VRGKKNKKAPSKHHLQGFVALAMMVMVKKNRFSG
jgi:hypothetical protein